VTHSLGGSGNDGVELRVEDVEVMQHEVLHLRESDGAGRGSRERSGG
jgi:hypothetical protein